ncbi:hypothetical protein CPB86DRAFT_775639 [Serendipita vermifera]|nr:hypothetical protein CPB86DRAFT_775639 [Serendipita vermifera]
MLSAYAFFLLALLISTVVATPINRQPTHQEIARAKVRYEARQAQEDLTGPVTFQTVTTTQTPAGTITQTCNVTLTPEQGSDGQTVIKSEKVCNFKVDTGNTGNGGGNDNGSSSTTSSSIAESTTTTQSQETQTATASETTSTESASATTSATVVPAISEIGVTTIPASEAGTPSPSASASATGSTPPAISVIGTGQIPTSAAGTPSPAPTSTATLVTSVTTLSDGSLSTLTSTPSAAAAQEAAATTPGKKLEVLPIGLGVFAGVSVIALIVVGLVTYERTKYRKAFRQRKLAEAGANMGYGGMA